MSPATCYMYWGVEIRKEVECLLCVERQGIRQFNGRWGGGESKGSMLPLKALVGQDRPADYNEGGVLVSLPTVTDCYQASAL